MNFLYLVNYFVFSTLITLFVLEIGIAILSLIKYDSYKNLISGNFKYFWGVVGTFAVFYLVNLESTYPGILVHLASIYELPFLITAILILVKNTFAAYSEHFYEDKKGKVFNRIYAVATIISGIFVVGIITSLGSGAAVNLASNSLNLAKMIFNPFSILTFLGFAIFSFFMAQGFNRRGKNKHLIWVILPGFALLAFSSLFYMSSINFSLLGKLWIPAIELIFIAATILSYLFEKKFAGFVSSAWLLISIFFLGILQYPYTFGKGINLLNDLNKSPSMGIGIISVVLAGYLLLIASFLILKRIGKNQETRKQNPVVYAPKISTKDSKPQNQKKANAKKR